MLRDLTEQEEARIAGGLDQPARSLGERFPPQVILVMPLRRDVFPPMGSSKQWFPVPRWVL